MPDLYINCPHCGAKITEKDFQNDHSSDLDGLRSIFEKEKSLYKEKLRNELRNEFELEKSNSLNEQRNNFEKTIFDLESKLEKQELEIRSNIEKEKNKELSRLNQIILDKEKEFAKLREEMSLEKINLEKELSNQIQELKIANAEKRAVQNKFKGENFEKEVFSELLKVFNEDKVYKITDQDKKADFLQDIIKDSKSIGKIVYEVKNAVWSNAWEKKLIEDTVKQGAKYGLLVATSFNDKYPNIPFKRSDENPNIYFSNPESFVFVAQMIKSLIIVENKLLISSANSDTETDEKRERFIKWRDQNLVLFNKILFDSCEKIKETESSLTKQIEKLRIAREKIFNNWEKNIKLFLEEFSF